MGAFLLTLAPAVLGCAALWWSLARADPGRISTFFIGSAGIALCGASFLFYMTVITYHLSS